MLNDMPDGDDLLRCLSALQRAQGAWLADLAGVCATTDVAFTEVFRRWQEQLTSTKLHLHRSESRLLHFVLTPQVRELHQAARIAVDDDYALAKTWQHRLEAWFHDIHLETTYRRLENLRDLDNEPVNADIISDLVTLAELAEQTAPILVRIAAERDLRTTQDLAFFGVLAPWRVRGLPALHSVLGWLAETLSEEDDW
jgi:hypothetical protein